MNKIILNRVNLDGFKLNPIGKQVDKKDFEYLVIDREFKFDKTAGGKTIKDGAARIETIKGNSVVWNQLISGGLESTKNGVTLTKSNGAFLISTTSGGATQDAIFYFDSLPNTKHKLLLQGCPSGGSKTTYFLSELYTSYIDSGAGVMFTSSQATLTPGIVVKAGTIITTPVMFAPKFIDLTLMFGAGNEPTTIEEFYARKPLGIDEYAYNEGEVIHNATDKIESVGVNQWDEEWEVGRYDVNNGGIITGENQIRNKNFISVLPSTNYYLSGSFRWLAILEYDDDKNFLRNRGSVNGAVTTSADCSYVNFYTDSSYGTTYKNDICINISDPSVNGKYFPYVKREQSLDIIRKYFPNGMKSAGSAHDEIRYNKATQKWEYSKGKFGTAKFKDLNWIKSSSTEGLFYARLVNEHVYPANNQTVGNILCALYSVVDRETVANGDKSVALDISGNVFVKDSAFTDASAFKTHFLDNDIFYYETIDWEWVELDTEDQFKDLDYDVWNCGTEKAIANTPSTPLKADIRYKILKNKLKLMTLNI